MSEREPPPSGPAELRAQLDAGLAPFLSALDRLSEAQQTELRDAAGWTVRDHLTHLVAWADGVAALLRREDRWSAMGLANVTPPSTDLDYDSLNEQIAVQQRHLSASEARAAVVAAHGRLVAAVAALSDEQLELPHDRYVAPFTSDTGNPVGTYIAGNSFGHYEEHLPWIEAIAAGRPTV